MSFATNWPARSKTGMPSSVLPGLLVIFFVFGLGANALVAFAAIAALLVGALLLWRPGMPLAFMFSYFYQWTQASIAIFYANWLEVRLDDIPAMLTLNMTYATVLSLVALIMLAIGINLGSGRADPSLAERVRKTLVEKDLSTWLKLYAGIWLFSTVAQISAYTVPGLSQVLLAAAKLKWAGYVLFTAAVFVRGGSYRALWVGIFAVEFVLSLGGYFSEFKEIFFYTFIALATVGVKMSGARALMVAVLFAAVVALGVVWTAIKGDYRKIVNGGSRSQVVRLDFAERVSVLTDLVSSLHIQKIEAAGGALIARISYVGFFGAVLDHVPSVIEHEGGNLWIDALIRPLTPRLFFPDKSILDDSATTRKYTGIGVAGASEGTSISIGYVGESYIDFGVYGMMPILVTFGFVLGRYSRLLIYAKRLSPAIGMAVVCPMLVEGFQLESALPKLIGGLAVYALFAWLVIRFLLPRLPRQYRT